VKGTSTPIASTPPAATAGTQDTVQTGGPRRDLKSKRDRRSLYMDDSTMKRLNDAYKQFNHDAFPQEVKKVAYLNALVTVALSHGDELRELLLGPLPEQP